MNNLDRQYLAIAKNIIENGYEKDDRTGTGTISLFGTEIRHKMSEGFPLLTTKKVNFKNIVSELLWFLSGDDTIEKLLQYDNKIWIGDLYKNYQKNKHITFMTTNGYKLFDYIKTESEFVKELSSNKYFSEVFGSVGKSYGHNWTNFGEDFYSKQVGINQIKNCIKLLKTNPDSRRILVTAWNPKEVENEEMVLPCCHIGFQFYTRLLTNDEQELYPNMERAISLKFTMRSSDVGLGMGYNLASYGLLLMMFAQQVNMLPDELIGSFGDTHLYKNHIEPMKIQLQRVGHKLPTVEINKKPNIFSYNVQDFKLNDYICDKFIKFPLSN